MFRQVGLQYLVDGTAANIDGRNFAENVGINFQTPEEFFLKEAPRPFTRTFEVTEYLIAPTAAEGNRTTCTEDTRTHIKSVQPFVKKNEQDIVLFCGSPGAGKSTFYWKLLQPLGYARVNQDTLKTVRINNLNQLIDVI